MKEKLAITILSFLFAAYPSFVSARTLNLEYSTYLGGNDPWGGHDSAEGISLGPDGRVYVTGLTHSTDFPTENPCQASINVVDVFVTALSSSGSTLYYSTYIGGSDAELDGGIVVGTDGKAYIVGTTYSWDFPRKNAFQQVYRGQRDAFVSVLTSTGSDLYYSTFLGGTAEDFGWAIDLGPDGKAAVTGYTYSDNFPLENSYQDSYGGLIDVFVTTFSSSGEDLYYSTYLGGGATEHGKGISVDENGLAFVTGDTFSDKFPTKNPYQASLSDSIDVFITAFSSNGSSLCYSTYLGGSGDDYGRATRMGPEGKAYLTGHTYSADFPTLNPYQSSYPASIEGWPVAFVSALSSTGSALFHSTYFGGSEASTRTQAYGIDVGTDGTAYVTGYTESSDFPLKNPYQGLNGSSERDAFVTALSPSGSDLIYSTCFGGSEGDTGYGITAGPDGAVYICGGTASPDFPTKNPYQSSRGGNISNAFVSKLTLLETAPPWIYDYNGDGISDIAVFRESSGLWAIRGITRIYFGSTVDLPVPGDYDGDGTTEIGIYRSADGLWVVKGITRSYFGSSVDTAVPGDYNGDGECDIGIFRGSSGLWAIKGITRSYFGGSSDSPVPGYYDGDSTKDIGIFRGSSGLWAIKGISRVYFGGLSDRTVPGDYDGDGSWEVGIFRGSSGLWAIRGVTRSYFGSSSDFPVPGDYNGDASDDFGNFRDTSGLWAIRGISRFYFGASEDIPVTR